MPKIIFVLSLILSLKVAPISAQTNSFEMNGYLKGCNNCKISLRETLFEHNLGNSNLEILSPDGKFLFTGQIFDPTEVRLIINDTLYTTPFFLESGKQSISLDLQSLSDQVLSTGAKSNSEYQNIYSKQMDQFQARIDDYYSYMNTLETKYKKQVPLQLKDSMGLALKTISKERDSALLGYIQQHPKSMVALWNLYYRVYVRGYDETYQKTYNLLDKEVAASYTGTKLQRLLDAANQTRVGATFPNFTVLNLHKSPVNIFSKGKTNYTLIDFWFSGCLPCIRQFKDFKDIFNNFRAKGFAISGVSIDTKADELVWKQAIIKHQLPWIQLWDIDGKVAAALAIKTYPTNFLVDKEGKIVARDIEPHELNTFLETVL